jgi:hypothetical protein
LVGFPVAFADPGTIPVADTIHHLVPEASVVRHNIFRRDIDVPLQHQDEGDENEVDVQPDEEIKLPTSNPDDRPGRDGPEAEQIPADMPPKPGRKPDDSGGDDFVGDVSLDEINHDDDVGDSASVTTVAIGDFFSSAWIGKEAYHLLERIQRETLRNESGNATKILLAGHGLGGIVVKQVHTSPQLGAPPGVLLSMC